MSEETPFGDCPHRADGKCIGADRCLWESDHWIQQRVLVRTSLADAKASSSTGVSSKQAHAYYTSIKLSEGLGSNRESFLDGYINTKKKCAFEKLIHTKELDDQLPDETGDSTAMHRVYPRGL